MQGEDQERFEDYLELEHFIEELQAGHAAHPPGDLSPGKARIYRMAALFRSATPEEAEPRPEFVAELQTRLEQELGQPAKIAHIPFLAKKPQKRPRVSRRALLTRGAAIAASMVVGAGIERAAEQIGQGGTQPPPVAEALVPPTIPTTWFPVTTVADLGSKAVKFTVENIVGYVIRNDGDDNANPPSQEPVIAFSAACTHMGCIVNWSSSDRKYHCPCHGGVFSEYGGIDNTSNKNIPYLAALPRLDAKVVDGKVYVRVPAPASSK